MVKIGRILIFLGIMSYCPVSSVANEAENVQVSVSASPNPTTTDESIRLQVEVTGSKTRVGKPTFHAPDFDVVGQSNSIQTTSKFVAGQFVLDSTYRFFFLLYPKTPGTHTISQIKIPIGSDTTGADDVIVQVKPGSRSARGANTPQSPSSMSEDDGEAQQRNIPGGGTTSEHPDRLNSDFTVHLALNKKSAYVGEPIVAEYWLYDFGNLVQMDVKKWPSFNGFWKEDLEIVLRPQFEGTYLGNRRARRALLGRYALYGIKPGKVAIDKLVVNGSVIARTQPDDEDPFNIPFFGFRQQRNASHASQEVVVDILPLPEAGKPANFGGAVGNFTVVLRADKTSLDVNTPVNIQVEYQGTGNFPAVIEPKLSLPADFEVFESTVAFKDSAPHGMSRPVANKKTFNFVVIPRNNGSFTIPKLDFAFFNPQKKTYQVVSSDSLSINVTGNAVANFGNPGAPPEVNSDKKENAQTQSLFDIISVSNLTSQAVGTWILRTLALLLLAWLLFELRHPLQKMMKNRRNIFSDPTKERAQKLLKELRSQSESADFADRLEDILTEFANSALKMETRGMTKQELENVWAEQKLPPQHIKAYSYIFDLCASIRYSAQKQSPSQKEQIYSELEKMLRWLK